MPRYVGEVETFGNHYEKIKIEKVNNMVSDGSNTILSNIDLLEHHFSNIEQTRTCSSIGDRTRLPKFWLRTNGH